MDSCAAALRRPAVRWPLMIFVFVGTLVLGTLANLGVVYVWISILGGIPSLVPTVVVAFLAFGGLTGILAAWSRLLYRDDTFRHIALLRKVTGFGLALGTAVAASLVGMLAYLGPDPIWLTAFLAIAFVTGVFLLAATLSPAQSSTRR